MAKYRRIATALSLILGLVSAPALAQDGDDRPAASDPSWGLCAAAASKVEADLGLPAHILTAISLAETGRPGPNRQVATWPWTVHDGTRGYHFDTEEEAINFVRGIRTDGRRSIDVGCMQVNLLHHPRAFTSVGEGFDAEANIRYAASFLKVLATSSRSWEEAIAKYHTQNPTIDEDYAPKVLAFWVRERARGGDADQARQTRIAAAQRPANEYADQRRLVLASAAPVPVPTLRASVEMQSPASAPASAASPANAAGAMVLRRVFDSAR